MADIKENKKSNGTSLPISSGITVPLSNSPQTTPGTSSTTVVARTVNQK
jgi:hypothetical protein